MQMPGQSHDANSIYKLFNERSFKGSLFCFSIAYIIQLLVLYGLLTLSPPSASINAKSLNVPEGFFQGAHVLIFLFFIPMFTAVYWGRKNLRLAGLLMTVAQVGISLAYIFFIEGGAGFVAVVLGLFLISWIQDLSILALSVCLLSIGQFVAIGLGVIFSYEYLFLSLMTGGILSFGIYNNRKSILQLAEKCAQSLQAQEQALRQLEMRSQLFAQINHEIRNPVNSIIGYLEVLQETGLDKQQGEYARTAQRSSNTLLHIVDNVLDFTRIESGALKVDPRNFKIRDLHDEVIEMFALSCSLKGVSLESKVDGQIPEVVKMDPQLLKQILINLVGNAVKFTAQGKVQLEVYRDILKSQYTWIVRDTGCGIKKDNLENIFQIFYQERNAASTPQRGTGLGLVITKNFIESMGGQISVCSEFGEGTVFTFSLPISES